MHNYRTRGLAIMNYELCIMNYELVLSFHIRGDELIALAVDVDDLD